MAAPSASIVVPTRGGAKRLPRLFDCLRAQTSTDFEVIAVIDGDTDNSEAIIAAASDLPVRAIVFPENRGRSAALNAGFAAATGNVFIRCDDDLEPAPNYVAAHVARHQGDACGAIGLTRNVFPPTPYARAYGRRRDVMFREEAYRTSADNAWRYWAANVSVTRETYSRIGDYDEAFRGYGWEDVDWGYRLHIAGVPIVIAHELETIHSGPAATTAARVAKAFDSGAARWRFAAKHGNQQPTGSVAWDTTTWGFLVHIAATSLGRPALVRVAHGVDFAIDYLPAYLSEKLISLLVEASAQSAAHLSERRQDARFRHLCSSSRTLDATSRPFSM